MSHLGQNVGLGGWVGGKFPRIFTDMIMILVLLSLQAYRKWVREHWEEPRLPGMMLTNEQVFFISFARVSEGRMILTHQN